ncbi:MAG: transcription termination factor Rho [Verrucomicrobia bacterium]|nr:transcription termination factor Rho [Verrucomicrobiota bacterium]
MDGTTEQLEPTVLEAADGTSSDGGADETMQEEQIQVPERVSLNKFQQERLADLYQLGASLGLRVGGSRSKHQLVFEILTFYGRRGTIIDFEGILEVAKDGCGFVRDPLYNFAPNADDIWIAPNVLRKTSLRSGQQLSGTVRVPSGGKDKWMSVATITHVEGVEYDSWQQPTPFDRLTALFPKDRIILENPGLNSVSARAVDLIAPLGKGQRGLIAAPPRGGKTILLKEIARSIKANHPEIELMVLLLDERPEEVTDFEDTLGGMVYSSTFDEAAPRHAQLAEVVMERAMRLVELGRDVVILLDSLTRLARGYNRLSNGSGGTGSGGLDPKALQRARKFFSVARNVEEGGSLTILATALIETESRMDEVIFEEFKGTGNMELQLDRRISNRRIYPAIDILASGTRREDLLMDKADLQRIWILRKHLADMNSVEAMEFVKDRVESSRNNEDFLASMNG